MKTFLLTATYLVGIGELILAWYFWKTNSKNEIRRVMAAISAFVGFWVLSIATTVAVPEMFSKGLMIDATYLFGVLLTTSVLWLAIVFPYRSFTFDQIHSSLLFLPCVLFAYFLFVSDTIVQQYIPKGLSGVYIEGKLFPVFGLYLTVQYIAALLLMVDKLKRSDGIHRTMLRISLGSLLVGGSPAVLANLFIPVFSGEGTLPFVGTLSTAVWFGATTYAVTRR